MYMELEESQQEKEERLRKEKSFSSKVEEEIKDEMLEASIEASIDQATGLVNLTLPLDQFQLLMSIFKTIDRTLNNGQGMTR